MKYQKFFFGLLLVSAFLLSVGWKGHADAALQTQIAAKILRFHVLANSDSEGDQTVKLAVRDAVGAYLEPLLSEADGRKETESIVEKHLPQIVQIAEATLRENGYGYSAKAELSDVEFPVKTYGDYTFPAGNYRALEVTLGAGAGHNWWCVLYPNMCFQGSVYEVTDGSKKALREVLTQEEYAKLFSSGKLRIRLKFLDYFR